MLFIKLECVKSVRVSEASLGNVKISSLSIINFTKTYIKLKMVTANAKLIFSIF